MGEQPGQQCSENRREPSSLHHRSRETRRVSTNHLAVLEIYVLTTDVASESSHTFTMPTPPHSCSWELDRQITLLMWPAAILTLNGHETTFKEFLFFFFFLNLFIYFLIYFWLCWVFVSMRGLSPVAASGGHSSSRCAGLSLSRPLPLRGTGSRRAGSVIVAHGLSCSVACGIFPDQGSNLCPLHWQADS